MSKWSIAIADDNERMTEILSEIMKQDEDLQVVGCLLYTSVYCVEDNKLVRTSVTVGLMDDEHAVIEDGLTADSLVVDNWSAKLRNGAEVEIVTLNGEDVVNNTEEDVYKRQYL